ncbi:MAG: TIR domain-containing protein, partial [Polyangiales bacterium]
MQNTAATILLPASLFQAYARLLRAAADRLGLADDLLLGDRERRRIASEAFTTLWAIVDLAYSQDDAQRMSLPRFARLRHYRKTLEALRPLAENLSSEAAEQLALLVDAGVFDVAPEQWASVAPQPEAALAGTLRQEGAALGAELSHWLTQADTLRLLVELFAVLLESGFAAEAPLPKPGAPLALRSLIDEERLAALEVWRTRRQTVLVSQIVNVGPMSMTMTMRRSVPLQAADESFEVTEPSAPPLMELGPEPDERVSDPALFFSTPYSESRPADDVRSTYAPRDDWRSPYAQRDERPSAHPPLERGRISFVDPLPEPEPQEAPPPVRQPPADVCFTVFRPNAICPGQRFLLLACAHLARRGPRGELEELDPSAALLAGPSSSGVRALHTQRRATIPKGTELTFIPAIPGVDITPRSQSVSFSEDMHRVEFQLRTTAPQVGSEVSGAITVYCGPLIVGVLSVTMRVVPARSEPPRELVREQTMPMFRRIYAAYADSDTTMAQHVRGVMNALGEPYLEELTELRSGEAWSEDLAAAMHEASVFQLFWSRQSMRSPFVSAEWQYALSLGRQNFVRPTYWEDPLPGSPPTDLARLRFERLPPMKIHVQNWLTEREAPPVRAPGLAKSLEPKNPQPVAAEPEAFDAAPELDEPSVPVRVSTVPTTPRAPLPAAEESVAAEPTAKDLPRSSQRRLVIATLTAALIAGVMLAVERSSAPTELVPPQPTAADELPRVPSAPELI